MTNTIEYIKTQHNSITVINKASFIWHKKANGDNNDGQYNCGGVYSVATTLKPTQLFAVEGQQLKDFPKRDIRQLYSSQSKNGCDGPNIYA
jgi:hypothetical protein